MKTTLLTTAAATLAAVGCAAPAIAQPLPYMDKDGAYIVGVDIRPGLYLTLGATAGGTCSWIRRSAGGDNEPNLIDRGESSAAQYAQIYPTDYSFETYGCQGWKIGSRPATAIDPPARTCIYPLTGCLNPDAERPRP